ncbi:MAG: hypothetical protein ACYCVW_16605 [Rhodocyclaceae bacterium]
MLDFEKLLLASAARICGPRGTEAERARTALTMAVGMLEGLMDEDAGIRELARRMYAARLEEEGRRHG